jgi:type II secretory pathway component PulM
LIFTTLRFVLMGVALPLATIHLWIAVAGGELRTHFSGGPQPLLKRLGSALARAFSSESVLIYALGLIVFFVLPYAALWLPFSPKGNKTDFVVFILRLVLTYVFSFIGWVVTISALTRNAQLEPEARQVIAPSVSPGTATVSEVPSPS